MRNSLRLLAGAALTLLLPAAALAFDSGSNDSATGDAGEQLRAARTAIAHYDYDKAEGYLKKVIAASPDNADALNLMGFSERKLGHPQSALVYYNRALGLQPDHLGANEYLGELYLEMKDLPKAQARLAVLQRACGGSCEEYGDLKSAIDKFRSTQG
jgi:tetratricopeptide (TPR) repeat protein